MIELTFWKNQMTEDFQVNGSSKKRAKIDKIGLREFRIMRGRYFDEHVLPYLL